MIGSSAQSVAAYPDPGPWLESRWESTRAGVLADYACDIQGAVKLEWMDIASAAAPGDIPQAYLLAARANHHAARVAGELSKACVGLAFDEDLISQKAKKLARICLRVDSLSSMRLLAKREGVMPPDAKKCTELGQRKRLQSEKWWRRKLHVHASRKAEGALRERGLVHKFAGVYVSDASLARRKEQKARQRNFMGEITAVNDLGESMSMTDIIDASMANPALRRAELMTRISGYESIATHEGHVGVFLTFTTPSRYHCRLKKTGKPNPKYAAGNDPRKAQEWLRKCWSQIRAQFSREGFAPYGFRIAEPNHDGTTHWHMLLFLPLSQLDRLIEICRDYMLRDSGDEQGAEKRRFVAKVIDPAKGSAAGYIAKYVAKNIDGHEVGRDFESQGEDATETALRVDAWASTWGIRQFQPIGGPPVGVWRELRRIDGNVDDECMELVRAAADRGDWAAFVASLGGIEASRSIPVTLEKEITGELNEFDELRAATVVGLRCAEFVVQTRERTWVFVLSRDFAASWTCVNNCTVGLEKSGADYYSTLAKTGPPPISGPFATAGNESV